jgi:ADP-ribose pyrophosphatase YjhB (NUDIX family)
MLCDHDFKLKNSVFYFGNNKLSLHIQSRRRSRCCCRANSKMRSGFLHGLSYVSFFLLLIITGESLAFFTACCNPRHHATSLSMSEPPVPHFCADCGSSEMVLKVPEGDERVRACCEKCGRIEYSNPKIVAACVVRTTDDRTLLAKRAIEPRNGTWGIPQGYMEHGETSRQAAVREVFEETGAVIDPRCLKFRAVYNVPGSVQLVYEATVETISLEKDIEAYYYDLKEGGESLEVALLTDDALAEKEICFPTVSWALAHCRAQPLDAPGTIQQKTKFYDSEEEMWRQIEDEVDEVPS